MNRWKKNYKLDAKQHTIYEYDAQKCFSSSKKIVTNIKWTLNSFTCILYTEGKREHSDFKNTRKYNEYDKAGELISFWQFENYANIEPHFRIDEGRNARIRISQQTNKHQFNIKFNSTFTGDK